MDISIWETAASFEEKLKIMKTTFSTRKDFAMQQTVMEEVNDCPPLRQARYVSKCLTIEGGCFDWHNIAFLC